MSYVRSGLMYQLDDTLYWCSDGRPVYRCWVNDMADERDRLIDQFAIVDQIETGGSRLVWRTTQPGSYPLMLVVSFDGRPLTPPDESGEQKYLPIEPGESLLAAVVRYLGLRPPADVWPDGYPFVYRTTPGGDLYWCSSGEPARWEDATQKRVAAEIESLRGQLVRLGLGESGVGVFTRTGRLFWTWWPEGSHQFANAVIVTDDGLPRTRPDPRGLQSLLPIEPGEPLLLAVKRYVLAAWVESGAVSGRMLASGPNQSNDPATLAAAVALGVPFEEVTTKQRQLGKMLNAYGPGSVYAATPDRVREAMMSAGVDPLTSASVHARQVDKLVPGSGVRVRVKRVLVYEGRPEEVRATLKSGMVPLNGHVQRRGGCVVTSTTFEPLTVIRGPAWSPVLTPSVWKRVEDGPNDNRRVLVRLADGSIDVAHFSRSASGATSWQDWTCEYDLSVTHWREFPEFDGYGECESTTERVP